MTYLLLYRYSALHASILCCNEIGCDCATFHLPYLLLITHPSIQSVNQSISLSFLVPFPPTISLRHRPSVPFGEALEPSHAPVVTLLTTLMYFCALIGGAKGCGAHRRFYKPSLPSRVGL